MNDIVVAGAGTGDLTHEVQEALNEADVVLASPRFESIIPSGKKFIPMRDFDSSFTQLEHEHGNKLILLSGDSCLFSLLPMIKKRFTNIRVLPGISSLQALCARAGEMWNDAVILSGHGRTLRAGTFLNIVERNRIVILFCDKNISPKWACENLIRIHGLNALLMDASRGWDGTLPVKPAQIPVLADAEERLHYFIFALKKRGIF